VAVIMSVNVTVVVTWNMRIWNYDHYLNRTNQLIQLHIAVCCATQLVASTVVCSSEGTAEILFKWRGVWTECWTDYSILERAECIMWLIKLPNA